MAGIIERLTEGVVNRDMRAESHALLTKWERKDSDLTERNNLWLDS